MIAMHRFLATLWAGSIWFSALTATVLFSLLADNKALAGKIAGTLFKINGYIGLVCGSVLLLILIALWRSKHVLKQIMFYVLTIMLILVIVNFVGIQMSIENMSETNRLRASQDFAILHAIGRGIHLSLAVLAIFLVTLNVPLPKKHQTPQL